MTDRIIELEIKIAYQEDLLQTLNNIVTRQQQQIERLENTCKLLYERQNSLAQDKETAPNAPLHEIPPHY